jgi:hypothetical protein
MLPVMQSYMELQVGNFIFQEELVKDLVFETVEE